MIDRRSRLSSSTMPIVGPKRLPKLTEDERELLRRHEGCSKCRSFYADHRPEKCKKGYPSPYTLSPLNEEAAVTARSKRYRDPKISLSTSDAARPIQNQDGR